jgi:hypothetical protein
MGLGPINISPAGVLTISSWICARISSKVFLATEFFC